MSIESDNPLPPLTSPEATAQSSHLRIFLAHPHLLARRVRWGVVLALALVSGCASVSDRSRQADGLGEQYAPPPTIATVDLVSPASDVWKRIRRGFAIPNLYSPEVERWTTYYVQRPESLNTMMQRASRYLYHIVEEIERRRLPTELALLPFIESAWNPVALSRSKASGLWQFIPSTGRYYQLRENEWLDERRDPVASTNAALNYLSYLFEFQGDWHLALASYNWGEGAVMRAIKKNQEAGLPTDYLSLSMPDETRNYVPKLQAIKNIVAQPQRYGIVLPHLQNEPYFVVIPKERDIDVTLAAKLADMPLEEFLALNPAYKRGIVRGTDERRLLLPVGHAEKFLANLAKYDGPLVSKPVQLAHTGDNARRTKVGNTNRIRTHKVKSGDTLYGLANRYRTTVKALLALNRLKHPRIRVGQTLRVPDGRS